MSFRLLVTEDGAFLITTEDGLQIALEARVAAATGTSTATAIGASTASAVAQAAGTSTANAVGASISAAVATAAGTSTANAVGTTLEAVKAAPRIVWRHRKSDDDPEPKKRKPRRVRIPDAIPTTPIVIPRYIAPPLPSLIVAAKGTASSTSTGTAKSAVIAAARGSGHGFATTHAVSNPHITGIRYDIEFMSGEIIDTVMVDIDLLLLALARSDAEGGVLAA